MKVLPSGSIVLGSRGSPTTFHEFLNEVDTNRFSGYMEVRMRIPGAELWGVIVFDHGKLVESYANRMGTDIFGDAAYMYLMDLTKDPKTKVLLRELDSDNIIDCIMMGRGQVIKIEDDSWRPEPSLLEDTDETVAPRVPVPSIESLKGEGVVKKVVLLGDPSVGKTSIMRRFVENIFDDAYLSTIGSNVNKKTVHLFDDDGKCTSVKMMVWDIAGDKACHSLKKAYYRGAHAGIVVCDITMHETFESIPDWIDTLYDIVGRVPVVVLGNKSDLEEFKRVNREELVDLADDYKIQAIQTSARTGENVEFTFHTIAKQLVED